MWELDYKKSWAPKNWCFWIVVLEKTLESPLDCKEIQPVHPKRNQSWIFIGRTDAEAETPILWPPDAKSKLNERIWMLGKIKGRRGRGQQMTRWLDGIIDPIDMSLSKLWEMVKDSKAGMLQSMGSQRVRHDWVTEQQDVLQYCISFCCRRKWIIYVYAYIPFFIELLPTLYPTL